MIEVDCAGRGLVSQLEIDPVQEKVKIIKDALESGQFNEYEIPQYWSDSILKTGEDHLTAYLFAIAIDPKRSEEDKGTLINKEIPVDRSFYNRFVSSSPAIIATHILRYYKGRSLWYAPGNEKCYFRYVDWMKEILGNHWSIDEKKSFMKSLFDRLDSTEKKEVLNRFILDTSDEMQKGFSAIVDPAVAKLSEELKGDIIGLSKATISSYFVKWFKQNALEHRDAARVVAQFKVEDWRLLTDVPGVTPLVVKWMQEVAKLQQEGCRGFYDLRTFFQCSSEAVANSKVEVTGEQYSSLSSPLNAAQLFSYWDQFDEKLQGGMIQKMIRDKPEKVIEWFEEIRAQPDEDTFPCDWLSRKTALGKISSLFALIKKNGLLEEALCILFDPKQNHSAGMLTIYSALDCDLKREILQHLGENRIEVLFQWMELCVSSESDLRTFVRSGFAKDLKALLQEIDPSAEEKVREEFKDKTYCQLALPSEDLQVQQHAINQLQFHFQNPATSHERSHFIRSIKADLEGGEETAKWLVKIQSQLPKSTWPFFFLYFIKEMCGDVSYHQSSDSKQQLPSAPNWQASIEDWIGFNVDTLAEILNTPYLHSEKDKYENETHRVLEDLYLAAAKYHIVAPVLKKFIERVNPEYFVEVINRLPRSRLNLFKPDFNDRLFVALAFADVDRLTYVTQCLKSASHSKDLLTFRRTQDQFWQSHFLQNEENCSIVAKRLIASMGFGFLERFHERLCQIIPKINAKDPAYCEELFFQWTQMLCQAGLDKKEKLEIFQSICRGYNAAAIDVIEFLGREQIQPHLPHIQKWHQRGSLRDFDYPLKLSLSVLHKVSRDSFSSEVFERCKDLIEYPGFYSPKKKVGEILTALKELGFSDEYNSFVNGCEFGLVPRLLIEMISENK